MPRMFGVHELELKPGVSPEAFETYFQEQHLPGSHKGKLSLFKGDKGDRAGKYLLVVEFADVSDRDRLFEEDAQQDEDVIRVKTRFAELITNYASNVFTDYVELYSSE